MKLNKIIIAGGGTGGHIFPAIAVAHALQKMIPSIEILFVGAKGKMEMEKVPQAGFRIEGIDIAGFNRSKLFSNWKLPFMLIRSFVQVRNIFKSFQPDAAFGVGGYSSFPVLRYAQQKGVATFLHEANSFAGKSNLLLSKKADLVMVGTRGMERFFDQDKMVYTGNPVRREIVESKVFAEEAFEFFGLKMGKPTVLVMGGSLGAKSINEAMGKGVNRLIAAGIQVIWQTGKGNIAAVPDAIRKQKGVCVSEFITKMSYAYKASDIVVSRAGAIALAEICASGKPSVLVPFPLAAEDHQTVNAQMLVSQGAACIVRDNEAKARLVDAIIELINDKAKCTAFGEAAIRIDKRDADKVIATLIVKNIQERNG